MRYLLATAALCAGEVDLAREEANGALEWLQSEWAPAEQAEWLPQLREVLAEAEGGEAA